MDFSGKMGIPFFGNMVTLGRWPLTISTALLSLILIVCLSFAINASHANKLNYPAMEYHRTGLGWIVIVI